MSDDRPRVRAVSDDRPRVRAGDLARVSSRALYLPSFFTAERMQGPGFAFALLPVLRRLYRGSDLGAALSRHLGYFNTHPVLAGYVLGAAARLEERRARGESVSAEQVEALKRGLASPLAALGDPLFWVTLRPLAGLVGVLGFGLLPATDRPGPDLRVLLCPLLVLLTYNAVALPLRVPGVARGYASAEEPVRLLRALRLREWRATLERLGAFAYGGLAALTVILLLESASGEGQGPVVHVAPLVLGAVAGLGVLGRWPGRLVEAALTSLGLAALLSVPF